MENYYAILDCNEDASYEALKSSYQKLVKEHHPDKNNDMVTTDTYRKIDEAWRILRNEDTRKEYDAKLMNNKMNNQILIYDRLSINDLQWDPDNNVYTYNCRCGGIYVVTLDLVKEDCTVSCDECSFVILLKTDESIT